MYFGVFMMLLFERFKVTHSLANNGPQNRTKLLSRCGRWRGTRWPRAGRIAVELRRKPRDCEAVFTARRYTPEVTSFSPQSALEHLANWPNRVHSRPRRPLGGIGRRSG